MRLLLLRCGPVDFGRLASLEGVSFDLPPVPDRSRALLEKHARKTNGEARPAPHGPPPPRADRDAQLPAPAPLWLRSGAPAWARKDWIGRLYPRGLPDKDFLKTYAQRVDAIELNASYYRVPSAEVLDAWAADVPPRFRFCPKLHQSLTHRRALEESADEALRFGRHFLRLGEKLGPAFLQLPPWLDASGLGGLDTLLAALPAEFRVAVEFRHPSWFVRDVGSATLHSESRDVDPSIPNGELRDLGPSIGNGEPRDVGSVRVLRDDAVRVLERWGAGAVITDVAGRRDACHASITAPFLIVRFVGNGLHPTDLPRADAWIDRLVALRALGLDEAYLFVHQPDDALAPELLAHVSKASRDRGLDMPAIDLAAPPPAISPSASTATSSQLDLFGGSSPAVAPGETSARPARSRRKS